MNTVKAMFLRAAREALGTPESFSGEVYVTKNGTPELFITTAADRAQELADLHQARDDKALVKLVGRYRTLPTATPTAWMSRWPNCGRPAHDAAGTPDRYCADQPAGH